jgi:hypothetical protein
MAPVLVVNRRIYELIRGDVVEAGDIDSVELTAELIQVAASEWFNTASAAKEVLYRFAAEKIFGQGFFALQKPKCLAAGNGFPESVFRTKRAIALARTVGQVEIAFEADSAAVTAAVVGLFHAACSVADS